MPPYSPPSTKCDASPNMLCAAEDDADEVAACSRRFAEGVRRFWRIKRVAELERLLEGAPGSEEQEAALLDDFVPAACVGC